MKKELADKFRWFKYEGTQELEFKAEFNHPDYILDIKRNGIVGLREYGKKYWCVHANDPDIVFRLRRNEYTRVIDNCKGWSGKVGRTKVKAGIGGKDNIQKLPDVAPSNSAKPHTGSLVVSADGKPPMPKRGLKAVKNMDVSESSNLRKVQYDPNTKTMYVEFRSGAVWAYEGVTAREFKEMDNALPVKVNPGDISHGVYFHRNIRNTKSQYQIRG